ncbi:MAG: virulence factor [Cucumibacter sp.]
MSQATIIYWREIPTQITVGSGRKAIKRPLSGRFMVAVDKAAMAAGATSTDKYLEDWRKVPTEIGAGDPEVAADALAAEIERDYPAARLAALARGGGIENSE